MNRKREDWIEVLKEAAVSDRDGQPPGDMWDRISASLGALPAKQAGRRRRIYVYAASAAAAALIALAIFMSRTTVNDIPAYLTESQPVSSNEETASPPASGMPERPESAVVASNLSPMRRIVAPDTDLPDTEMPARHEEVLSGNADGEHPAAPDDRAQGNKVGQETARKDATVVWPAGRFRIGERPRRRMLLALSAGGVGSGLKSSASNTFPPPMQAEMVPNRQGLMVMNIPAENYSYRHRQPLTFAVTFDAGIGHGLFAGAGISYTFLSSSAFSKRNDAEFKQLVQYVGIPVSLKWAFLDRERFMLYTGVEGQAEFCVGAKFDGKRADMRTMQWSAHLVAGAQVNLGKHVGIYVEPKLSHYFLDTELKTIRNTKGVNFNLQLGLRFSY